MQLSHVSSLLQKELAIEFRQKFAVSGVFLFAAAVVFIVVKTFQNIPVREWVLLVWIILLFSGLNAVVKSFLQEKKETWHYYYTLFDPVSLLVAKLIYNLVFLCLVFVCILLCFAFFTGFPVKDPAVFASGSLLGILGLATIFTFVSVMAAADQGGAMLMSILALPLTLPVVLLLIKVSFVSTALMTDTDVSSDLWMLAGIDLLLLGIALLLFPYIWKS